MLNHVLRDISVGHIGETYRWDISGRHIGETYWGEWLAGYIALYISSNLI